MIIYGTKAENIKSGKILNVQCPKCEENTSMNYSVFGKYFYLYWIPFFPYEKISITECNSCRKTFESEQLPKNITQKLKLDYERNKPKYPFWMFSGLIFIICVVLYSFYYQIKTKEELAVFIKEPKVGDLYHYRTESRNYSLMKIYKLSKDSILFLVNDMESNQKSGVKEFNSEIHFKEVYGFSKKDILTLYKEKKIFEINRD
jgi:hypothetical protein